MELPKGNEFISQSNRMTISYYPTFIHVRIPNVIDFNVTIMKPTFGIHGSGANYVSNFKFMHICFLLIKILLTQNLLIF